VKVGSIDAEALARDRDQLLAEAIALYRQGVQWWPEHEFEAAQIRPEQEARYEEDAWEDPIAQFLAGTSQTRVTILEVAKALFIEVPKLGTADQRRIIAALERLGWERGTPGGPNCQQLWVRGTRR
jgi:predicted P-loop ATPase